MIHKGYLYRVLANRTYLGEASHKGKAYPGEHTAIITQDLWDRVHAMMQPSPRTRANENRTQSHALLKGLPFGLDGRALSPMHSRTRGKQYRYNVAQGMLKDEGDLHPEIIRRIGAAEIEAAVVAQIRALVRQPEVMVGTWRALRDETPTSPRRRTASRWGNSSRCGKSCSRRSTHGLFNCWSSG